MHKLVISAPFGNYLSFDGVTSTVGTYTLNKRAGIIKRLWRFITRVNYYPYDDSWRNNLALPNPGIRSVKQSVLTKILSIHGFNAEEWLKLMEIAIGLDPLYLELNLSCPNVDQVGIKEAVEAGKLARKLFGRGVIAKLAPMRWMDFVRPLVDVGIDYFHLCNTIPSPAGGYSGKVLKNYSLWAVEEVRKAYSNVKIIGGGGVTDLQDVYDYVNAGANHVAVGSMLFNPFNWRKLKVFKSSWPSG